LLNDFNAIMLDLAAANEIKLSYNDLVKKGSAHVGAD